MFDFYASKILVYLLENRICRHQSRRCPLMSPRDAHERQWGLWMRLCTVIKLTGSAWNDSVEFCCVQSVSQSVKKTLNQTPVGCVAPPAQYNYGCHAVLLSFYWPGACTAYCVKIFSTACVTVTPVRHCSLSAAQPVSIAGVFCR